MITDLRSRDRQVLIAFFGTPGYRRTSAGDGVVGNPMSSIKILKTTFSDKFLS
jgi:hypothetical protein